MKQTLDFLQEHWAVLAPILLEIVARIVPTGKNLSLIENAFKLITKILSIIPNNKTGGGTHVIVLFVLSMLCYSVSAQNNSQIKALYSFNTQDSTGIKTTRDFYQSLYNNTGGLYFNKLSNKWRVWAGTCPTCSVDSTWVDLLNPGGSGGAGLKFAKSGVHADLDTVKLGGALTESAVITAGGNSFVVTNIDPVTPSNSTSFLMFPADLTISS